MGLPAGGTYPVIVCRGWQHACSAVFAAAAVWLKDWMCFCFKVPNLNPFASGSVRILVAGTESVAGRGDDGYLLTIGPG